MADLNVNSIGDASGGNTATINSYTPTESNMAGRNRIINGDMRIDQRNAGAAVTPTASGYTVDRWRYGVSAASKCTIQQNAGSVTPPVGFTTYLGITSTSAYSVGSGEANALSQKIEGFNTADLAWGTANAKTVTLSFWIYSSLTGSFGGSVRNSGGNRSYPFSYTVSSVNTWEYKTITISGDTTGTWLTDNSSGVEVIWGIGVGSTYSGTAGVWAASDFRSATGTINVLGTSGATFYITGVQLEAGSVATPFERRQYGQELALCERYYYAHTVVGSYAAIAIGAAYDANAVVLNISFKQTMRISPSLIQGGGTNQYFFLRTVSNAALFSSFTLDANYTTKNVAILTCAPSTTGGYAGAISQSASTGFIAFSAEL